MAVDWPRSTHLLGTPIEQQLTFPPHSSNVNRHDFCPTSQSLTVPSLLHDNTLRPLSIMVVSKIAAKIKPHAQKNIKYHTQQIWVKNIVVTIMFLSFTRSWLITRFLSWASKQTKMTKLTQMQSDVNTSHRHLI
jgi:hypothetical protein